MRRVLLVFLLIFLPQGSSGNELPEKQSGADKKERIFSRIERATSSVKTIACDFLEEKHMAMLEEVLFSKGRFYFEKPDRLRWELIEPGHAGFAVQGNWAKRWHGQKGAPSVFEIHEAPGIKAFTEQVFAWTRADFVWLEQGYNIRVVQENPVTLNLFPRSASEKDYLDHLRIVFAADLSHVNTVEIHEVDGDFTRIRFMNIVLNGPRRKDLF